MTEDELPKGVIVLTSEMLQTAEAEVLAEYRLRGDPVPDHSVTSDTGDTCDLCQRVGQRAAELALKTSITH